MESIPSHEKFTIIQTMADRYSIQMLCTLAEVSRSGYYKWLIRMQSPSAKRLEDEQIKDKVKECHEKINKIYGYRRIQTWLQREYNLQINHKRVQRLMKEMGIKAI